LLDGVRNRVQNRRIVRWLSMSLSVWMSKFPSIRDVSSYADRQNSDDGKNLLFAETRDPHGGARANPLADPAALSALNPLRTATRPTTTFKEQRPSSIRKGGVRSFRLPASTHARSSRRPLDRIAEPILWYVLSGVTIRRIMVASDAQDAPVPSRIRMQMIERNLDRGAYRHAG
jgi:hypothetical protein